MSETEHHIGKLKPTGKRINEYIGDAKIPDYYKSVAEFFDDEYCERAYVIDGLVFEIEMYDAEEQDIFTATKNDGGTIDFQVKYYNGGCGFNEALDNAMKTINIY